jgi:hypothetical protein
MHAEFNASSYKLQRGNVQRVPCGGRALPLGGRGFPMSPHRVSLSRLSQLRMFDAGFPALSARAFFPASAHPSEHLTDADRSQGVHEFERAVDHASDRRPAPGVFDRRTTPEHRPRNQACQARIRLPWAADRAGQGPSGPPN